MQLPWPDILVQWAMPPAALAVGTIIGLLVMTVGRPRMGYLIVGSVIAETLVLSFPPAVSALLRPLEDRALLGAEASVHCCYDCDRRVGRERRSGLIADTYHASPDPSVRSAIWQTARLYHDGVCWTQIIVSGGSFPTPGENNSVPEAETVRIFLLDLGVPSDAIALEEESHDTIENIKNVRKIIKDGRVLLVTSAYHMPRAMRIAASADLHATPYPVDFHRRSLAPDLVEKLDFFSCCHAGRHIWRCTNISHSPSTVAKEPRHVDRRLSESGTKPTCRRLSHDRCIAHQGRSKICRDMVVMLDSVPLGKGGLPRKSLGETSVASKIHRPHRGQLCLCASSRLRLVEASRGLPLFDSPEIASGVVPNGVPTAGRLRAAAARSKRALRALAAT